MATYKDTDEILKEIFYQASQTSLGETTIPYLYWKNIVAIIKDAPTADVVPKSEVDTWYQLYHSIKEELKLEKMYHRETENLCDRYCIESQQAKKQVAREIFEEINKIITPENHPIAFDRLKVEFAELKKKYTEGKDEQASTRDPI